MDEQQLHHRSPRLINLESGPEVFTARDYTEARALEQLLEQISYESGLTPEDATHPSQEDIANATALLQVDITPTFRHLAEKLLLEASSVCQQIITPFYPYMLESERAAYDPDFIQSDNIPIKPFIQQLRYFLARYTIEEVEDMVATGSTMASEMLYANALQRAQQQLQYVPGLAHQLYSVDIPAYEHVFDQFDEKRKQDENHTEVYLGRDGIYAYYARLGEMAARGDIATEPIDGVSQFFPVKAIYMVYSRSVAYIKDQELKESYIMQHLSEDDSPQFFDTGYNGSIPQDIMAIMGYSEDEINERIHLLECYSQSRQIQGLPVPVRISYIEDGPKPEESATDLSVATDGVVRYHAKPATISEQFKFSAMRSILLRHFWLRERQNIMTSLGNHGAADQTVL